MFHNTPFKTLTLSFLFVLTSLFSFSNETAIPESTNKLVNNYSKTGFINQAEEKALEQKLETFANQTSNQIVIVIIDDLSGMEPWRFATELGQKWRVGQQKMSNGIVVLIKPSGGPGQRKFHIAVGKGLEGVIPDATCHTIQQNELIPYLKQGQHYQALNKTTDVLMALAIGEYNSDAYAKRSQNSDKWSTIIMLIVFVVFMLISMKNGGNGNGGRHNNGISYGSAFILGSMLNGGGSRGGGFGGSSGGFGGFGGGSFGGGGAGGSW